MNHRSRNANFLRIFFCPKLNPGVLFAHNASYDLPVLSIKNDVLGSTFTQNM